MIAGIVVTAVGDELQIAHPLGHATPETTIALLGGPALFLAGHALFKYFVFNIVSIPRLVAIVLLILVGVIGQAWPPLVTATGALLILIGVSVADVRTAHYREQRALHLAG
jgi:low temperature requirement protein LtrA